MSASPVSWWGDIAIGPGRELELRWARWAVRHFAKYLPAEERRARGLPEVEAPPPLWRGSRAMPIALQAERWGAPVPTSWHKAAEIARRGYAVLDKWRQARRWHVSEPNAPSELEARLEARLEALETRVGALEDAVGPKSPGSYGGDTASLEQRIERLERLERT